jgi:hypothetical protein
MMTKARQASLVVCLFLFLFVVIGSGLHLTPGGALLAAATGTPLVVHFFTRTRSVSDHEESPPSLPPSPDYPQRCDVGTDASHQKTVERETLVR